MSPSTIVRGADGYWGMLFKVCLVLIPVITTGGASHLVWSTSQIFKLNASVAALESDVKTSMDFIAEGPRYTKEELDRRQLDAIRKEAEFQSQLIQAIGKVSNEVSVMRGEIVYLTKEVERLRDDNNSNREDGP